MEKPIELLIPATDWCHQLVEQFLEQEKYDTLTLVINWKDKDLHFLAEITQ